MEKSTEQSGEFEKRFELLSNILRASHFEWRRAAQKLAPNVSGVEIVKAFWREVGLDTAQFYLRKIDPKKSLAAQVAKLYISSSVAMGEDAILLGVEEDLATSGDLVAHHGEVCAQHRDCPWYHWHKKMGLLKEDQPGCDEWLRTVVEEINKAHSSKLRFETVESLPEGGKSCLRRFWEES